MKKLFAVITLLVYFTVSTGFVVSLHYCMDQFDSVQLGAEQTDKCDKCGMHKKDNGCCRDQVTMIKLQATHIASQALIANFSLPAIVSHTTDFLVLPFYNYTQAENKVAHSPPLSKQDTYLQNCVFRL